MVWNLFTILVLALLALYFVVLPKLFVRAGRKAWEGLVPFYNFYVWLTILKRPWYWVFLFLVPGINLLVLVILNVETGIVFNQREANDQWLFGALPWWKLVWLAFSTDESTAPYVGARDWSKNKKSRQREWGEAILFAIIVATVVRSFFFEAFTIPTGSMEGSLKVGDYLFVSKMSYGAKSPMTPLSFPFLHNAIPGTSSKSYLEWAKLPYFRLPGFGKVERFDPVVFNFPVNDTLINTPDKAAFDYYGILISEAYDLWKQENGAGPLSAFIEVEETYKQRIRDFYSEKGVLIDRPLDKRENFIKRAIGLPGDDLEVRSAQVYIDGEAIENPKDMLLRYAVITTNEKEVMSVLKDKLGVRLKNLYSGVQKLRDNSTVVVVSLSAEQKEKLSLLSSVKSIERYENDLPDFKRYEIVYPHDTLFQWTMNDFGPIHIPAKGETIDLDRENVALYARVITAYEHNKLEKRSDGVYINGSKADTYTFQQDYYWMMGDNRNGSLDSRAWGFVPEDHVVGKAVFRWFSRENANQHLGSDIRWDRMFQVPD